MLASEANWIAGVLNGLTDISPVLNIGSSTAEFREQVQPWIDKSVFAPLRKKGVEVQHLDMRKGKGIDLRGDLFDDGFFAGLAARGYRSIMCCNVLEHVHDPAAICSKIEALLPVGGYLIVTVPNRFPYHPDPIDTMFRPDVAGIARLFPNLHLVRGQILNCGTGWDYVGRNPFTLITKVRRRLASRQESGGLNGSTSFAPWLFRQFRQSCALFQA